MHLTNQYHHMLHALRLAQRGLGTTAPNPAVGCVVVKDGHITGTGWTQAGGRPHAEPMALQQAGENTSGASLYVTLEPCSHHGKTPPCTDAIIAANIAEVYVACSDPDPRVSGSGIAALEAAGITVHTGLCEAEAQALNAGFFRKIQHEKPLVGLKLATSLDGYMATASGHSQWITGKPARNYGHLLRSRYDAILTGSGTALADDPSLTCRLAGLEATSPQKIVLDSQCRIPLTSKLFTPSNIGGEPIGLWVLHDTEVTPPEQPPESTKYFAVPKRDNGIDLEQALRLLAKKGITRLLVEAGPTLSTAFLKAGLVDRLYWFRAPTLLGSDGLGAIQPLGITTLEQTTRWQPQTRIPLGEDVLEVYKFKRKVIL